MKRILLILHITYFVLAFESTGFSQEPETALVNYVNAKDTSFKWQQYQVLKTDDGTFYEMNFVSQKWQNITWAHRLMLYIPAKAKHPDKLLLMLRHLYNRNAGLASLKVISDSTSTSSAILYDIPNQPLFDGKEEDDLQAYTFSQYIKTGDESWPLLFPMVKAVVRAMDAIQGLTIIERQVEIDRFIIAGHSKRGHTTWLTAAVDARVKGIIPIAIDVLNAKAQLPHHLEAFGAYSTPSEAATEFLQELDLPLGKNLIKMVDPFSYKENITVPKLIVSATNDDFFLTDALNLYWDELRGSKWILYLSNASHVGADNDPRINNTAFAFVRAIATDKMLPQFSWVFNQSKKNLSLKIVTDASATNAVA